MSLEPLNARSGERHTHESGSISEALLCPTCEQPVSPELHRIIQGKERARAAEIERGLQARFASGMAKIEATKKAEVESARKNAAAQIEKAKREAATREAAIRQQAAKTAKAAFAPKLAEAEQQIKALKADQRAAIDQRLREQREALDKARVEAVNAEKATAYSERMRLDAKLQELTRQLQKKTANEVADLAEVDLYKMLKSEFAVDNIL